MRRYISYSSVKSLLYVPGNQISKLQKCQKFSPSAVIPDMEDSVPIENKNDARKLIASTIPQMFKNMNKSLIYPRVNALTTSFLQEDINTVIRPQQNHGKIKGYAVVLKNIYRFTIPKIETINQVKTIIEILENVEKLYSLKETLKIYACYESALGLVNMQRTLEYLCQKDRVVGTVLGGDDYLTDVEIQRTEGQKQLEFPRQMLILYSKAFNIPAYDTPYPKFRDPEGLRARNVWLKQLGFSGATAIHPNQVDVINQSFRPSEKQVINARRIIESMQEAMKSNKAATSVDGKMVDIPVYKRAKKLIERVQ